jgi:hypothetical protein
MTYTFALKCHSWPRRIESLIALVVKALKLTIYLFYYFDPKFDFKSIKLVQWYTSSNQVGQK